MDIKDCRILTGNFGAYIACPAENGHVTLKSRREITEDEILNLIAWWLNDKLEGTDKDSRFINLRGKTIIEVKRLRKYDI